MSKIKCHGKIGIHAQVRWNADTIKFENYTVNTPAKFHVRDDFDTMFKFHLASHLDIEYANLDFVYFSVCKGAEPHVDQLDPAIFTDKTFVIPVILPKGKSVITAEDEETVVKLDHIYEFNHEKVHSMILEDVESGCVVIMVAVKK